MTRTLRSPHDRSEPVAGDPWRGFIGQGWRDAIDTRGFLQDNYTPWEGDADFLVGPTARTSALRARLAAMFPQERERDVYDVDAYTPASITAHAPGLDRPGQRVYRRSADRCSA